MADQVAANASFAIEEQKLFVSISGRRYVKVEGWVTCSVMCGVTPREVSVVKAEDGTYTATVELVRMSDERVVSRASAECGADEPTWMERPNFARRSMSVTRATGKAARLAFSWIVAMSGFEPTPLEELPEEMRHPAHNKSAPVVDVEPLEDLPPRVAMPAVTVQPVKQMTERKIEKDGKEYTIRALANWSDFVDEEGAINIVVEGINGGQLLGELSDKAVASLIHRAARDRKFKEQAGWWQPFLRGLQREAQRRGIKATAELKNSGLVS